MVLPVAFAHYLLALLVWYVCFPVNINCDNVWLFAKYLYCVLDCCNLRCSKELDKNKNVFKYHCLSVHPLTCKKNKERKNVCNYILVY